MQISVPLYRLKREATRLSRETGLPRHAALDRIARREGFRSWSQLARQAAARSPAGILLARFRPGDLVLLAARPGQGKTLLGLELALEAIRRGRDGLFFSLEDSERQLAERLDALGVPGDLRGRLATDLSDEICAATVLARLARHPAGSVAVIDYLQLLDQKRGNPELARQVADLRAGAAASGAVIVLLSQVDRRFDAASGRLPGPADVRLPNPVDLSLFARTCFLHAGEMRLHSGL